MNNLSERIAIYLVMKNSIIINRAMVGAQQTRDLDPMLGQCWPPSTTLVKHCPGIGSMSGGVWVTDRVYVFVDLCCTYDHPSGRIPTNEKTSTQCWLSMLQIVQPAYFKFSLIIQLQYFFNNI